MNEKKILQLIAINWDTVIYLINLENMALQASYVQAILTHRGPVDLRKWAIFNTMLMSPKSRLSQEDLDAGCEHSMVHMDSEGS